MLAAFPAFYKSNGGVDLYAISAQNEPDFTASYQSCLFNASQMVAWIDVLGPALAALNPPVKVLAAEPDNWGNIWGGDGYGPAIIADVNGQLLRRSRLPRTTTGSTSAGTYGRPAPPANNTHHVWETECTPGDTGPITIATMIYAAFTTGGVNGWHYWWTEALVPNASSPPAQVYALGNFSKFVRPGYYRVDVSGAPRPSGTAPLVVAFTNPSDGTVAIVVVNGGGAAAGLLLRRGHGMAGVRHPVRHDLELQAGRGDGHLGLRRALLRLARRAVRHDLRRKALISQLGDRPIRLLWWAVRGRNSRFRWHPAMEAANRTRRIFALDVAPSKHGFIVRIGPMFLSLDRHAAEELMYLLAEALEVADPLGIDRGSN